MEYQEIIEKIRTSSSVLLVSNPEKENPDKNAALFSLFYSLKNLGKNVNLWPHYKSLKTLPFYFSNLNNFLISINKNGDIIPSIYYQDTEKNINLYLTANGKIKPESIYFAPLKEEEPNLIIALDLERLDLLGEFYDQNFKYFLKQTVINLNNEEGEDFGQINFVKENFSLSGIVLNLLKELNKDLIFDRACSTNLLWGMLKFYENKSLNQKEANNFETFKDLPLDYEKIKQSLSISVPLEKLLKNCEVSRKANFPFFRFNLQEDKISEKEIKNMLGFLRGDFTYLESFAFVWETHSSIKEVKGVIYSPSPSIRNELMASFPAQNKNNLVVFKSRNKDMDQTIKNLFKIIEQYGKNN